MNRKHNIDINEFQKLYNEKGLIYNELAIHFGCSLGTIRRFAKRHKVTPIRGKSKHRKILIQKSDIPLTLEDSKLLNKFNGTLTSIELEVILGCLLGDSSSKVRKNKNNKIVNVVFGHSESQKDYLKYTHKCLKNISNPIRMEWDEKIRTIRGKEYKCQKFYGFATKPLSILLREIIYENDIKKLSWEYLENLTPRSLAFWYMDDGSLNRQNRVIRFCTMCFTKEEHNLLKKFFYEKLKMPCFIAKATSGTGYELVLTQNSSKKFMQLIEPYMCDSMKYKLLDPVETLKASKIVSKEGPKLVLNIAEHSYRMIV